MSILCFMRPLPLLALLLIPAAFAHLAGGEDRVIDGYRVDFGYEPEDLIAGQPAALSFSLPEADALWLRISGENVVFAGTLDGGSAILTYAFPAPGDYQLTTRFFQGDTQLAETTFSVRVAPAKRDIPFVALPVALGAAFLALWLLSRYSLVKK